jgi:hypothetical protein
MSSVGVLCYDCYISLNIKVRVIYWSALQIVI